MKNCKASADDCAVGKTLQMLGGKWRLRIINEIGLDKKRYGELKRQIPDISEKMLIQELKALVEFKLLHKESYAQIPPKVEYSLTERGRDVIPILDSLKTFSEKI